MTVATVWSPNQSKNIGDIVCPTNGVDGMFFRVTTAGTTGAGEPCGGASHAERGGRGLEGIARTPQSDARS